VNAQILFFCSLTKRPSWPDAARQGFAPHPRRWSSQRGYRRTPTEAVDLGHRTQLSTTLAGRRRARGQRLVRRRCCHPRVCSARRSPAGSTRLSAGTAPWCPTLPPVDRSRPPQLGPITNRSLAGEVRRARKGRRSGERVNPLRRLDGYRKQMVRGGWEGIGSEAPAGPAPGRLSPVRRPVPANRSIGAVRPFSPVSRASRASWRDSFVKCGDCRERVIDRT
jgi:hypothetical protein